MSIALVASKPANKALQPLRSSTNCNGGRTYRIVGKTTARRASNPSSQTAIDKLEAETPTPKLRARMSPPLSEKETVRLLKRMLLATTEALEHATERKTDPISRAHQAISTKSRKLLARID